MAVLGMGGGGFSISAVALVWIFFIISAVIFLSMIGWITYMFMTYNIKVRIYEAVGNSFRIRYTRARLKVHDNVHSLKFIFKKREIPTPDPKYYYMVSKKHKGVSFYTDGQGVFIPIDNGEVEKQLQLNVDKKVSIKVLLKEGMVYNPEKQVADMWFVSENKRALEKYKKVNPLLQYLPMIAFAVVVVVILIMMILILQKFDVLKDVSANLLATAETLKDVQHVQGVL